MLNYYSWWVGGGWVGQKKMKLMLKSTLVEIEVEVGVELGKNVCCFAEPPVICNMGRGGKLLVLS